MNTRKVKDLGDDWKFTFEHVNLEILVRYIYSWIYELGVHMKGRGINCNHLYIDVI